MICLKLRKVLPLCDYSHNIAVDRAEEECKSGANEVQVRSGINAVTSDHELEKRASKTNNQPNFVRLTAVLRIARVEELISDNHRHHGQKTTDRESCCEYFVFWVSFE